MTTTMTTQWLLLLGIVIWPVVGTILGLFVQADGDKHTEQSPDTLPSPETARETDLEEQQKAYKIYQAYESIEKYDTPYEEIITPYITHSRELTDNCALATIERKDELVLFVSDCTPMTEALAKSLPVDNIIYEKHSNRYIYTDDWQVIEDGASNIHISELEQRMYAVLPDEEIEEYEQFRENVGHDIVISDVQQFINHRKVEWQTKVPSLGRMTTF